MKEHTIIPVAAADACSQGPAIPYSDLSVLLPRDGRSSRRCWPRWTGGVPVRPLPLSVPVPAVEQCTLERYQLLRRQCRVIAVAAIVVARPIHDVEMAHVGVLLDDGLRVIR